MPFDPDSYLASNGSIQDRLTATAERYGVDPKLILAQAGQESAYKKDALSPKGAFGVMQLMPETAKGLGVDPRYPSQNIEGGVKLMARLLDKYKGDKKLALAAYNAGEGAVAKYGGVPPFKETQNYTKTILSKLEPSMPPFDPDAYLNQNIGKAIAPPSAPPMSAGGGAQIPSATIGGANIVFPGVQNKLGADKITVETTAREAAEEAAKVAKWQEFVGQLKNGDKPYADLTLEDIIGATKNPESAKSFLDLRDAFIGKEAGFQKSAKAVKGVLKELAKTANNIPSSKGFYGKQLQGPENWIREETGNLPDKTAFEGFRGLALPLLRRAFGDVGNVGQGEQKMVEEAVNLLAHPQKETRDKGRQMLESVFSSAFGDNFKLDGSDVPFKTEKPQTDPLKSMSTEDLLKQLSQ